MNNKMTINELRQFIRDVINEGMGIPEINKMIIDDLKNRYDDLSNYHINGGVYSIKLTSNNLTDNTRINSYFDDITINILISPTITESGGEYKFNSANINKDTNKLINPIIDINVSIDNYSILITKFLTHELLHVYEDYNRYLKNKNIEFKNLNKGRVSYENESLSSIMNIIKANSDLNRIYTIIYSTRDVEARAYISQLYGELNGVNNIREYIVNGEYKNLMTYAFYNRVNIRISDLINKLNSNDIEIIRRFMELLGFNFANNKDLDVFKNRFIAYIKKSSQNILYKMDKIVHEYLNDQIEKSKNNKK